MAGFGVWSVRPGLAAEVRILRPMITSSQIVDVDRVLVLFAVFVYAVVCVAWLSVALVLLSSVHWGRFLVLEGRGDWLGLYVRLVAALIGLRRLVLEVVVQVWITGGPPWLLLWIGPVRWRRSILARLFLSLSRIRSTGVIQAQVLVLKSATAVGRGGLFRLGSRRSRRHLICHLARFSPRLLQGCFSIVLGSLSRLRLSRLEHRNLSNRIMLVTFRMNTGVR